MDKIEVYQVSKIGKAVGGHHWDYSPDSSIQVFQYTIPGSTQELERQNQQQERHQSAQRSGNDIDYQ